MLKSIKNKASLLVLTASTFMMTTPVLAAGEAPQEAKSAIEIVYNVMKFIAGFLGVCFLFVGIIKWAVSQAEGGGADQHKSLQMVAAGVVLIAIGGIIAVADLQGLLPGLPE